MSQGGSIAERFVEVRAGRAEPNGVRIVQGYRVGPLSLGASGTWKIAAPGVLPEHAYLYFDGATLYMQSVDVNYPARVSGRPLPKEWTAIEAPVDIDIGSAKLHFGIVPAAAAQAMGPPTGAKMASASSASPAAAPGAPGAPAGSPPDALPEPTANEPVEGSMTMMRPIELIIAEREEKMRSMLNAGASAGTATAPATGAHTNAGAGAATGAGAGAVTATGVGAGAGAFAAPSVQPAVSTASPSTQPAGLSSPGSPIAASAAPGPQTPGAGAIKTGRGGGFWQEASPPKKATLVLLPIALIAVAASVLMEQPPAPPPKKPAAAATTTASAAASATPTGDPAGAGSSAAADLSAAPGSASPASPAAAASPGPARPLTPLPPGKKTPQRAAADAVAAGNFEEASRLYEDLAKANPSDEAYAEAARIVRAKAGKSSPPR